MGKIIGTVILIFMAVWLTLSVYTNHIKSEPAPIHISEYLEETEPNE